VDVRTGLRRAGDRAPPAGRRRLLPGGSMTTLTRSAKRLAQDTLPPPLVRWLDGLVFAARRTRVRLVRRIFALFGFNIVKRVDYYSTLPVLEEIEQTRARWDRPSALAGLDVDIDAMKSRLGELSDRW